MPYPLAIGLRAAGFASEIPATAGLQRARLVWAQPVEPVPAAPASVTRSVLLSSSEDAYPIELVQAGLVLEEDVLASKTALQYARGKGRSLPLAVLLEGRFPARDARPGSAAARVVVVGDSDWLCDPTRGAPSGPLVQPFFAHDNQRLFLNLVDWLALDDPALVSLRARQARDRSLRDFEAQERARLGLLAEEPGRSSAALEHDRALETRARSLAAWRRWRAMLLPLALTLLVVFAFGLAWNRRERRRPGVLLAGEEAR